MIQLPAFFLLNNLSLLEKWGRRNAGRVFVRKGPTQAKLDGREGKKRASHDTERESSSWTGSSGSCQRRKQFEGSTATTITFPRQLSRISSMNRKWSLAGLATILLVLANPPTSRQKLTVSGEALALDADNNQRSYTPAGSSLGRMLVLDNSGRSAVRLLPGLLDETLLSQGSFKFNTKTAHFDQLRVLGNVYVNRVNGRPLRESYLFRSSLQNYNLKRAEPKGGPSKESKPKENLRYLVLKLNP